MVARFLLLSLFCAFAWASAESPLSADVIELKTGQKLEAPVLKEANGAVYIDLGIDVLRIPLDQIKSREKSGANANQSTKPQTQDPGAVYSTARLPVKSVKDLATEYGEGVVLVQTPRGLGSGFILNERGHCVTNYHVIERETRIAVTIFHRSKSGEFSRRRIDKVEITALNPFLDLALLKIPVQKDMKFHSVHLARESDQKEGDLVFAIGNPHGLERSVSQGIVSNRNRNFQGLVYIQTTTQINPGNSGGPLFNARGEVVGVTNMKLMFGEGLGFAIPIAYVKHFLNNRDAFAYDKNNPNTGHHYLEAPRRRNPNPPPRDVSPQKKLPPKKSPEQKSTPKNNSTTKKSTDKKTG